MDLLKFATFVVAWASPAIALVVAWLTNRKRQDERAIVNVTSVAKGAAGGVEFRISNDGGRTALDVRLEEGTTCVGCDGLRAGKDVKLLLAVRPEEDFDFQLSFIDVSGHRYHELRKVERTDHGYRVQLRAHDHIIKVDRGLSRETVRPRARS